jgi:Glutathionylspermidine synthase preATP-grasp
LPPNNEFGRPYQSNINGNLCGPEKAKLRRIMHNEGGLGASEFHDRRADPALVQALSVGMDHPRGFRRECEAVRRALPRADVEEAAVQQGIAADPPGQVPEHENLLPAYRQPQPLGTHAVVRKPLLLREGANIRNTLADTAGTYADSGFIYQAFARPGYFDGHYANIGAWMVYDACCGMGIREDRSLVISNQSRFVPRFFE